ncbi:MAG: bL35 family ribosomal protein [bacterium]|nr:bL35 family ribosomal protein [bacterium]
MSKPNKSFRKRIRVTKTGKLMRRIAGHNHFNAKESGRMRRRKSLAVPFPRALASAIRQRM